MAEEKREESTQEAEAASETGGKMKLIIILALVMLLAGSGAGAYFYREKIPFVNKYFAKPAAEGEEAATEEHPKKAQIGPILPLDPFVFNLAGSQTKFAKISVAVEMKDTKVMDEAKKIIPVIRDGVLAVLSVKSPELLLDVPSREKLKKDIQDNLKGIFKVEGGVQAVYITDVVIQ